MFNFNNGADSKKMEGRSMTNAITIENVDFNRIYSYGVFDAIPEFGMFEEEKAKFRDANVKYLTKVMLNGDWVGNPRIEVDINTNCISQHNHTYFAYKEARKSGFDKPLEVIYVSLPDDKTIRMMVLLKDEHLMKYKPEGVIISMMSKDGEEPNNYRKIYDYCMGNEHLKGNGSTKFDVGYALIALFGESKKIIKQIKTARLNLRGYNPDYSNYDLINTGFEIANILKFKRGAHLESMFRKWREIYFKDGNKTWFDCGGWDDFKNNIKKVAYAWNGDIIPRQDDGMWYRFLMDVLNVTKGNLSIEEIMNTHKGKAA